MLTLKADRVAAFGATHVPRRAKHQPRVDAQTLLGAIERFLQRALIARMPVAAGYRFVGIDRISLRGDSPLISS